MVLIMSSQRQISAYSLSRKVRTFLSICSFIDVLIDISRTNPSYSEAARLGDSYACSAFTEARCGAEMGSSRETTRPRFGILPVRFSCVIVAGHFWDLCEFPLHGVAAELNEGLCISHG